MPIVTYAGNATFPHYRPLSSNETFTVIYFSGVGEERSPPRLPFRGLPGCLRPPCGMAEVGAQVSATFFLLPAGRNSYCTHWRGCPQWESIILFATICHWRSAFWLKNSVAFTGWPSLTCLWIFPSLAEWMQDIHSLRLQPMLCFSSVSPQISCTLKRK